MKRLELTKILCLAALALGAAWLTGLGCGAEGDDGNGGTGVVQVMLTDAPVDNVEEVNITVSKLEIHHVPAGGAGAWQVLAENLGAFDLLKLRDTQTLLGEKAFPAGKITQVRLFLSEANVVLPGGAKRALEVPSEAKSGLKLVGEFEVKPDTPTVIVIDFDAAQSLVEDASGYKLKPTIKLATGEGEKDGGGGAGN